MGLNSDKTSKVFCINISINDYQKCYLLVRMSMQINLQHVFEMSASRTRACIGTSLALRTRPTFSETVMVSVGVSKLGCTQLFFCRAGGENKRCLLPRRAADAEVIASH